MEFNFILKNEVISLLKKYLHHQNDEDDDYSVIWLQQVFFYQNKTKTQPYWFVFAEYSVWCTCGLIWTLMSDIVEKCVISWVY